MNEDMAYVAICKCGGIVMATMDSVERKRDVAKEVAACLRDGYEIKRITAPEVRASSFCKNRGKCMGPGEASSLKQMGLGL
jgi:hypothetical protein